MAPFLNGSLTRRAHAVTVQILLLLLPPSSHRRYNPTRCVIRQEVLCLLFVVAPPAHLFSAFLLYLFATLTATLDVHARDIAE